MVGGDKWRKHSASAEPGWAQPLRNWNSFWPLIELHYVITLYCISLLSVSVCLTLFQLHIKKAICSKKASQHTMRSLLIHKFPLPSIQTRHCPPSHQFSSLISSPSETKMALQSFILQQSKFHDWNYLKTPSSDQIQQKSLLKKKIKNTEPNKHTRIYFTVSIMATAFNPTEHWDLKWAWNTNPSSRLNFKSSRPCKWCGDRGPSAISMPG